MKSAEPDQIAMNWESPTIALTKILYSRQYRGWDNARIIRLASMLKCTVSEVLSWCGLFGARAKVLWNKGRAGDEWPLEVILHLDRLERFVGEIRFGTTSPPSPQEILVGRQTAKSETTPQNAPFTE